MRSALRAMAGLLAGLLILTACGGGSGSSSKDASGPIRLALMMIYSGPQFVKGQDDAFKLAVKEINAAGGINGRKVEYKTFDTGITPESTVTATRLALDYKPDAVMGYIVSAGLVASMPALRSAGVPVLHTTFSPLTAAKALKSNLTYRLMPSQDAYAAVATDYFTNGIKAKKVALLHGEDATSTDGAERVQAETKKAGITSVVRQFSYTSTDFSEPIRAAQGADAIWEAGFAQSDALTIKTAAQNGLKVPIVTYTAGLAAYNNLIPKNLLTDKVLAMVPCTPSVLATAQARKYVSDFTKEFGFAPNDSTQSIYYDGVYLIKAAIEKAGDTKGSDVAKALSSVTRNGVCGTFASDKFQNLNHNVQLLDFPNAKPSLYKAYTNLPSTF